jgi:hypothetical protein
MFYGWSLYEKINKSWIWLHANGLCAIETNQCHRFLATFSIKRTIPDLIPWKIISCLLILFIHTHARTHTHRHTHTPGHHTEFRVPLHRSRNVSSCFPTFLTPRDLLSRILNFNRYVRDNWHLLCICLASETSSAISRKLKQLILAFLH